MRTAFYVCLAILLAPPAAAEIPKVAPEGPVWDTSPGFVFSKKTRRSLSGIACPGESSGPRLCIAAFDEGGEAGYMLIDGAHAIPQPEHILLLKGDGVELDAEGAANDGDFAYVTGSHSRKRGGCISNPNSRHVYRLPLKDGRVSSQLIDDQGRLLSLLSASESLGPFVDKCLGKPGHGINIEGLAARNGQLYFGFREPAKDKKAYILRVAASALFDGGDLAPMVFTLEAGKGSGIRDLLAVREGLLVLVGPDDDSEKGVPWWIGFWDGSDASPDVTLQRPTELKLPAIRGGDDCQQEMKPEAMTLLADGPDFRRVLILSDGMCDGGPLVFRIPK